MSQDQSSMFSDAVYLFGTTFSSAPLFGNEEELPDGRWVNQTALAVQVVLAAFAYLYHKKLIAFVLEERKFLLITKKIAKVKKLQATAPGLRGLEFVIFSSLRDKSAIYGITQRLVPHLGGISFDHPWWVLKIVKEDLLQRGIVKPVKKGEVLFVPTYKDVVNGDISKEAKQVTELKKTLWELQSRGELYEKILSAIKSGMAA